MSGDSLPEHSPNRIDPSAPEWVVLLEGASPHPDGQRLEQLLRKSMDWPHLLELADEHGMLPLLAARLSVFDEAIVPSEVRQKLRTWQRAQTVFTLSLTA